MKFLNIRLTFSLLLSLVAFSLTAMNVAVNNYTWLSPKGQYLETTIQIFGSTITFDEVEEGIYSANVEVLLLLKKDGQIVDYSKYKMVSPEVTTPNDLIDLKRFPIKEGKYQLDVKVIDGQDSLNIFEKSYFFESKKDQLTDVALIKHAVKDNSIFAKHDYKAEPIPYEIIGDDMEVMELYTEVYNLDDRFRHFMSFEILDDSLELVVAESSFKKVRPIANGEVVPIFEVINLSSLISGKYTLRIKLFDSKKRTLASIDRPFLNYNSKADLLKIKDYNKYIANSFVTDLDSAYVRYSLMAIVPIVNPKLTATLDYVIRHGSLEAKKFFLLKYFQGEYKEGAETGFKSYMEVAEAVDNMYYSNIGRGFQMDRGYIYLRYGKPNKSIMVDDEPNGVPYEIWYYSFLPETNQSDVRFVFYNKSLVHQDFELLHSNCFLERNNPRWVAELYSKYSSNELNGYNAIDSDDAADNWGRRAKRLFDEY